MKDSNPDDTCDIVIGMKTCGMCGVEKDEKEFDRKRSGHSSKCSACRVIYYKSYYERNSDYVKERSALLRQKKQQINKEIADLAKSVPCTDCKIQYPAIAMDFDHISIDKVDNVSNMVAECAPSSQLRAEIAKCEVVCANCHRIRTLNRQKPKKERGHSVGRRAQKLESALIKKANKDCTEKELLLKAPHLFEDVECSLCQKKVKRKSSEIRYQKSIGVIDFYCSTTHQHLDKKDKGITNLPRIGKSVIAQAKLHAAAEYAAGRSIKDLAAEVGKSYRTVQRWICSVRKVSGFDSQAEVQNPCRLDP